MQALATPAIAALGVFIGLQQAHVSKGNLKERLFDRRLRVFEDIQRFLSCILEKARLDYSDLAPFNNARQKARFLFGKEISLYLDVIFDRSMKMNMMQIKIKSLQMGPERSKLVEEEAAHLEWLTEQLPILFSRFEPTIGFQNYR
ncbi:MAG: hypothetical protein KGN33_13880 [Paracoccaceae bacterium]|nr:hypothetical protein [Paracoccaceae bacterium]